MKAKDRLNQLKKQFERMRKDSVAAVGTANEALYAGLQKFADKELKALHDYYDSALASLKSQKKNRSGLKTMMQTQFDLMQETVSRMLDHARESIEAAAEQKPEVAGSVPKPAAVKKTVKKAVKKAVRNVAPEAPVKSTVPPKPAKKAAAKKPKPSTASSVPSKPKVKARTKAASVASADSTVPPKKRATKKKPAEAAEVLEVASTVPPKTDNLA